jgi:hypothetical protein
VIQEGAQEQAVLPAATAAQGAPLAAEGRPAERAAAAAAAAALPWGATLAPSAVAALAASAALPTAS